MKPLTVMLLSGATSREQSESTRHIQNSEPCGESAISAEMQKRVREMIKTFLERARVKLEELEGEEPIDQTEMLDSPA